MHSEQINQSIRRKNKRIGRKKKTVSSRKKETVRSNSVISNLNSR